MLILGAAGKIGSGTINIVASKYPTHFTPIAGVHSFQSSPFSLDDNLLTHEVAMTESESILKCIAPVIFLNCKIHVYSEHK